MSIFGGHFSALFLCVMTVSWNQPQPGCWNYLYYIFIHSCKYTTFQIKTVFNNVLFSTEVHNPLHAHLLALGHIYICKYNELLLLLLRSLLIIKIDPFFPFHLTLVVMTTCIWFVLVQEGTHFSFRELAVTCLKKGTNWLWFMSYGEITAGIIGTNISYNSFWSLSFVCWIHNKQNVTLLTTCGLGGNIIITVLWVYQCLSYCM